MLQFKQVFFRQISVTILFSCVIFLPSFGKTKNTEYQVPKAILEAEYHTVLYKAGVQIYDNYFSGIFFFRKDSLDSYRIVFLNEFGLTLLDYSYIKGEFTLNSCKEFLNKRMILNQLKWDLGILFKSFPENLNIKEYKSGDENLSAVKFKLKPNKYFYFYNKDGKIEKIKIKRPIMNRTFLSMANFQNDFPATIEFKHKPVKLMISLTKIKQD